jgi:prevent-host-death family protein
MVTVDVSEAEAEFEALLDRVQRGEEVVITREGKPVARMVATKPASSSHGLSSKELRDRGRS